MNTTIYDLEGWCAEHGLPWSTTLSEAFDKWGVTCVEHIKLLARDDFLSIFEAEKFIVRETAKIVWDKLGETPFDLSRATVKRENGVFSPSSSFPSVAAAAAPSTAEGLPKLQTTKRLGTLLSIDQTIANSCDNEFKYQQLETVANMWSFQGHQTNSVRLAVATVLSQGFTKTDIAKVIRAKSSEEWDGTVNNGNDKLCKRIMATLVRIDKMRKNGQLDGLSPSDSKTLVKGTRGNKKGVKRGPYKKKNQSLDSQSVEEVIEAAIVDNDTLSAPTIGEGSAEEANEAMSEEVQQEEQPEVAIESI
ncbi:hypothetical protein ACHAWO_010303 [Cyclotella atomus]|uniref:Uncharacterized protein n=1 Tax=Cyclotella atomus TaxID=382360 RepID=A0ABD3Q7X8_9STRA